MHSERGNKEFCSIKYNIHTLNKEIEKLELKKKILQKKRCNFVLCEYCGKHFRKNINFLNKTASKENEYHWICPYCENIQLTHYETSLNRRTWNRNDW